MPYNADKNEKEVLDFWKKDKTFAKSVEQRPEGKPYVFYDGPPFATGTPHYGHFPSSIMKDVVPRYWTMNGKRVERVWGWDCHGLPIENIVEKELGTKSKQEIEEMGVDKFNELCRSKVLGYVDEWEKTINRLGRWVDMKNAYRTMDLSYMESVWWVFKQLWDKDLIYEGYRSMHICPRCETTLSQQEVTEGYKNVKDLSVMAQFKINEKENTYILAWTTTPWTLPGNLLLAVEGNTKYATVEVEGKNYILAKELVEKVMEDKDYEVKDTMRGEDLVGLTYEPLFPYFEKTENAFRVVSADFVTTDEGTGVVHIAPGFGQDDLEVCEREGMPVLQHVGMDGRFTKDVKDFAGLHVKPIDDHMKTDIEIVKWLAHNDKLFSKEKYEHSYPHCWRCDTPLINFATSSWFVSVTKIKDQALKQAKKINWSPEHVKEGRFGKWLEGARDWAISRQRFWASVMPVWICDKNNEHKVVFGSAKELEEKTGKKVDDLHKHILDKITFSCHECSGKMKRIPDVLDTWFDSGSMPYAQVHYPFQNKEKFEKGFPAEFIAEGQDQTRAWFYYLHVLGTSLFGSPAYKNVIVNGIVLAEDGKKMSKRLKNYPDPNMILEKYGADALRYFMLSSPVMQAENMNFSEEGVREVYNKVVNTAWNVLAFYNQYADQHKKQSSKSKNVLDRWILSKLNFLLENVTDRMNSYDLPGASRPIQDFVLDLSQWYVRRSRDRFKGSDEKDKQFALATLQEVLLTLAKIMAPFTPFIAEQMHQSVTGKKESVHLEEWPKVNKKMLNENLVDEMNKLRKIVEMGLSLRKEAGVRVRQPLSKFSITDCKLSDDLKQIIADELNVKEITGKGSGKNWLEKEDSGFKVALDIEISEELRKEGLAREVVRAVNQMRKEQKLTPDDDTVITFETSDDLLSVVMEEYGEQIKEQTRSVDIVSGNKGEIIELDNRELKLGLERN